MLFDKQNKLLPYKKWEYEYIGTKESLKQLFFTSGGGTLFPPIVRTEDLFNKENIKSLSFFADDVWLNLLAIKNGVKVVKATWGKGTPITIDDNPEKSLVYMNALYDNNNDKCIASMIKHYDIDFKGID